MASPTTRSSRRAEGHTTRSQIQSSSTLPQGSHNIHNNNNHKPQPELPNTRRKRRRESIDDEQDAILQKKARLAVRVDSKPKPQLKKRADIVIDDRNVLSLQRRDPPISSTTYQGRAGTTHTGSTTAANDTRIASEYTKHAEKVVAGLQHELNRLQPAVADKKDEKRKLRSQEGTRFKSELALYFPDYDIVIGNEPEEIHMLNIDTPIVITDSKPQPSKTVNPGKIRISKNTTRAPPKSYPSALYDDLYEAQRIDFSTLDDVIPAGEEDPLPPSFYDNAHKRAERVERNIRNTEKGRAQHEKDQVIRLLEGLQSHDWLKIMGVSGITEGKRKDFTPARDHFVRGCQFIIEKFRLWKEEEKRRKVEKYRLLAEADDEVQDEDEDDGNESDGDPPDYSDVDHAAARQLHEEAMSRVNASSSQSPTSKRRSNTEPLNAPPPIPEKPFTSFYKKPHLREAALGKHRRSGRSVSAFGQPVPELHEAPFDLPEDLRDKDTMDANARKRRRDRRVNKD